MIAARLLANPRLLAAAKARGIVPLAQLAQEREAIITAKNEREWLAARTCGVRQ